MEAGRSFSFAEKQGNQCNQHRTECKQRHKKLEQVRICYVHDIALPSEREGQKRKIVSPSLNDRSGGTQTAYRFSWYVSVGMITEQTKEVKKTAASGGGKQMQNISP